MKTIPLTKGYAALVDDCDYDRLQGYTWFTLMCDAEHVYAAAWEPNTTRTTRRLLRMHRVILGLEPSRRVLVDHQDRNGLNNQRYNLRTCTTSQNNANAPKPRRKSSSRFRGVFWSKIKNRWHATIKEDNKVQWCGCYHREEDAALAYNAAMYAKFGDFSRLNEVEICSDPQIIVS